MNDEQILADLLPGELVYTTHTIGEGMGRHEHTGLYLNIPAYMEITPVSSEQLMHFTQKAVGYLSPDARKAYEARGLTLSHPWYIHARAIAQAKGFAKTP